MKKLFKNMFASCIICAIQSFSPTAENGVDATYGVSPGDPSHISLELHSNYTFVFKDYSLPNHKTKVNGTYTLQNNRLHLTAENSNEKFRDDWKIVNNGNAVSSSFRLSFYRLCKLD
ncbi:MAG: hypothetical protein GC181_09400 [Bacteroidetes bacterium]|nr:hypothetical protein [Bacteroidota bacterium]